MAILRVSSPYGGFQRRHENEAFRHSAGRHEEFSDHVFNQQTLTTTDDEARAKLAELKLHTEFQANLQRVDRRSADREALPPQFLAEKQKAYINTDIEHLIDLQNARAMDVTS